MLRILAALAVLAAVGGTIYAYNAAITDAAEARAEAQRQKERASSWKAAHDSLIDERELWDDLLTDTEHELDRVDNRRQRAERQYRKTLLELAEARRWAAAAVPDPVAAGLCDHPGSCARGESGLPHPGAPAADGTGTAAGVGEGWRLSNGALREGLENCRAALGRANGKIAAIRQWSER